VTAPATVCAVAVDPDLARRLATAGRKAEEWKDRRDELIREAARNGGTLREIAAAVGLSNPGVLRVIRRGAELEASHITPLAEGGDPDDDDNVEFLTPNEHARKYRDDG
jgi:transposase-like protein